MERGSVSRERIIVLAVCQKALSAANFYDYEKSPFFKLGELHLMHVLWVFYVAFGSMNIWYFYEHPFSPLNVAQILTTLQLLLIYHSLLNRKPLIRRIIRRLQQIIDDRCENSTDSHHIHEKAEATCSRISLGFIKGAIGMMVILMVPLGISPILYVLLGVPAPENWLTLTALRSPFDQQTFAGFYLTWLIEVLAGAFYYVIQSAAMPFFLGICVKITAMVRDMTVSLRTLNAPILASNTEKSGKGDAPASQIFAEFIRFHYGIVEITENIRDIIDGVLFYQMICCTSLIAFALAAFERYSDDMSFDLVISLVALTAQLFSTSVYCAFADGITSVVATIGDRFYDSLWYAASVDHQRHLIPIIQRSQRPIRFTGYQICDCSLATFATVIKGAVSYYLFLRKLE